MTVKPEEGKTGERVYTCTVCGQQKKEILPAPPKMLDTPKEAWNPKEGGVATFRSEAPLAEFIEVRVDGIRVPEGQYTLEEGSTIVKISEAFLATLPAGDHTVTICSESGDATTTFEIKGAVDLLLIILLISGGLILLAAIVVGAILIVRRRY